MALFRIKKDPSHALLQKEVTHLGEWAKLQSYAPLAQNEVKINKETFPVKEDSHLNIWIIPPFNFKEEGKLEIEKGFIPYLQSFGHRVHLWQWLTLTKDVMKPDALAEMLEAACDTLEIETVSDKEAQKRVPALAIITWGKMADNVLWQLQATGSCNALAKVILIDSEVSGSIAPAAWNGLTKIWHYPVEELQSSVLSLINQGSAAALVPKTAALFERMAGNDQTLELTPSRSANILGDVEHMYPAWHLMSEWLAKRLPV